MRIRVILGAVSSSIVLVAGLAGGMASAAPSTINVSQKHCSDTGPGTSSKPFCTVQEGVNAATSGNTVSVDKGTYNEQVTVPAAKTNLTINGNGKNTIIQAPSTMTSGKIVDLMSTGTTIENLTVNGTVNATSCSDQIYGVYFENGASASIKDASVTNIESTDPGLRGCQAGVAIRVGQGSASIAATATINNVTVSDYAKGGIVVDGAGSSAVISQSKITGFGPTTIVAQNGIQISRGATATVRQNTVKDNSYSVDFDEGTGYLFFQAGKVTVSQNTGNGNDVGFDVDANNSAFSQNTANKNASNGFFVESTSSGDNFLQNTARNNNSAAGSFDIQDVTSGSGTAHTANTYRQNDCKTSSPAGLCKS